MTQSPEQVIRVLVDALQKSVLNVAGTEHQRRAFIDGYNGAEVARRASAQMRLAHIDGARAREALIEGRAAIAQKGDA